MKRPTLLIAALLLTGCAARPQHPGTANAFDSGAYDTLLVTRSVIESTKSDIGAGSFPANTLSQVKVALNGLIDAYNGLEQVYCGAPVTSSAGALSCAPGSYHAAAMAGTATPAQSTQVQNAQNQVTSATSTLTAARKVSR